MLKLEFERRKRGLTQKALGAKTGITPSYICMIEKEMSKPFPAHAERLSKYFDMKIEDLLREVE